MSEPIISGNWSYVVKDGYAEIVGYTGNDSTVNIPATLDNIPVNKIGDAVFYGRSNITAINIPDCITELGNYAFAYTGITSLVIPIHVERISGLCLGCTSLQTVSMPDSVTEIGHSAFCGCTSLAGSITLPFSVEKIGYKAFCGCTSLTNVNVSGAATIYESAFEGCTSLQRITLTLKLERIAYKAFYNCASLTQGFGFLKNLESIDASAFMYCPSLLSLAPFYKAVDFGRHAFYDSNSSLSLSVTTSDTSATAVMGSPDLAEGVCIEAYEETSGFVHSVAQQQDAASKVYKIRLIKNGEEYIPSIPSQVSFINPFMMSNRDLYKHSETGVFDTGAVLVDAMFNWSTDFSDGTDFIVSSVDNSFTYGDVNVDGNLNFQDFTTLAQNISHPENLPLKGRLAADVNFDGSVTIDDLTRLYELING